MTAPLLSFIFMSSINVSTHLITHYLCFHSCDCPCGLSLIRFLLFTIVLTVELVKDCSYYSVLDIIAQSSFHYSIDT